SGLQNSSLARRVPTIRDVVRRPGRKPPAPVAPVVPATHLAHPDLSSPTRLTRSRRTFYHHCWIVRISRRQGPAPARGPARRANGERDMVPLVLLAALAVPGQCSGGGWGWFGPWGGSYEHGYGSFRPVTNGAGGIVLPPSWPCDPTPWCEGKLWFEYVLLLDGPPRAALLPLR